MAWKRPDHLSPPGLALGTSLGTRTTLVLPDFSAVLAVFSVSWLPCSPALPVSTIAMAAPQLPLQVHASLAYLLTQPVLAFLQEHIPCI